MWELRKTLLKAQKEKPPNKGQSPVKGALQVPLRGDVTTLQNPPQSGPPQSGQAAEPGENPPLSGRVTEPGKTHLRVVEPQSLRNPPPSGPSLNERATEPD